MMPSFMRSSKSMPPALATTDVSSSPSANSVAAYSTDVVSTHSKLCILFSFMKLFPQRCLCARWPQAPSAASTCAGVSGSVRIRSPVAL
jgi:hypothetical protein